MKVRDLNGNYMTETHPTMRQIQYLTVLEEIGNERGAIAEIAKRCNVNNAPVSRFLKSCNENGLLNEDYSFTEAGIIWLGSYKGIIRRLGNYFANEGMDEEECYNAIRELVENVDASIITGMLRNIEDIGKPVNIKDRKQMMTNDYLKKVLPARINTDVSFMIYRVNSDKLIPSMADAGFQKPARLKHNSRGSHLVFKTREITGSSRITGGLMRGHLDTLRYEDKGELVRADIKDGKLRIPLSACHIFRSNTGELRGMVSVTMTCNVGRVHMPESAAIIMFWM